MTGGQLGVQSSFQIRKIQGRMAYLVGCARHAKGDGVKGRIGAARWASRPLSEHLQCVNEACRVGACPAALMRVLDSLRGLMDCSNYHGSGMCLNYMTNCDHSLLKRHRGCVRCPCRSVGCLYAGGCLLDELKPAFCVSLHAAAWRAVSPRGRSCETIAAPSLTGAETATSTSSTSNGIVQASKPLVCRGLAPALSALIQQMQAGPKPAGERN